MKVEENAKLDVKIGDRVRYINDGTIERNYTGWAPAFGTWGTVTDIQDGFDGIGNRLLVLWDGHPPFSGFVADTEVALLVYED
jgi:hypothetical protein